MTPTQEETLRRLERRIVTTYAVVQFAYFCKLRSMGDPAIEPLGYLREIGFDIEERNGRFQLYEPARAGGEA